LDTIVLATTSREVDKPLAEYFERIGGQVYRGVEEEVGNVAQRFVSAARSVGADYAFRVNGDSPFPDPWLIQQGIESMEGGVDLVTNLMRRTYPYGVSAELVRISCLEEELPKLDAREREHVTARFYAYPERFLIRSLVDCPWPSCGIRLTVDEPGDLDVLEMVLGRVAKEPILADLTDVIAAARVE
jgi:spore coat polysaccharide biosynthesis protein SpsF